MKDKNNIRDFFQSVIDTPISSAAYETFDFFFLKKNGDFMSCQIVRDKEVNQYFIEKHLAGRKPIQVDYFLGIFNDYISKDDFRDYTSRTTHPANSGEWISYYFFIRYACGPLFTSMKDDSKKTDKVKDSILKKIIQSGKDGSSLTELQKVSSGVSADDRKEALQQLLDDGSIMSKQISTGASKPATRYFKVNINQEI